MNNDITSQAYAYVESMVPMRDNSHAEAPMWYGWALRDAFIAGSKANTAALQKRIEELETVARTKLRDFILGHELHFNNKVIHGIDDGWQSYSTEIFFNIPFEYECEDGGKYNHDKPPSMTREQAVDKWLDEIFGDKK